jgi:hypothetical protein
MIEGREGKHQGRLRLPSRQNPQPRRLVLGSAGEIIALGYRQVLSAQLKEQGEVREVSGRLWAALFSDGYAVLVALASLFGPVLFVLNHNPIPVHDVGYRTLLAIGFPSKGGP